MRDLSIIIVSYNTSEITRQCIEKTIEELKKTPSVKAEIIVVDNNSADESVKVLKTFEKLHHPNLQLKLIVNSENVGFAKANNEALAVAIGKNILFLNSDVIIDSVNFEDLLYYLDKNPEVGALTVRVMLPTGRIDWASHRGNPTLWRSFTYFSKLEQTLGKLPKFANLFGGYHLTHLNLDTIHEIDSPSGAFYLTRKSILDKTGGFDTRFFMYGEDLDLSHRIKKMGFKIVYYPLFNVTHLKYKSGIKNAEKSVAGRTKNHFYEAMRLFYDKHSAQKNWAIVNKIVYFFISLKEKTS